MSSVIALAVRDSLQTSMSNKRNFSNSSISPKVADKKSKKFVTPNRYAALYSDDSSDNIFNTSTKSATVCNEKSGLAKQNIEQPTLDTQDVTPPPFYISNISNFSAFTNELTRLTGPNAFTSCVNRSFRVAIRNLHHSTLCTEISVALSEEGHSVKQVINVQDKNRRGLPLFFVDLYRQNNNKDIFNITSLLDTKVIIEKPHQSRRGPPQCHNCQAYGHTDNYCQHESRCVKCGGDHRSVNCTKDAELVQPNARSVLRYTRPTTKDAVFINPLQKNAKIQMYQRLQSLRQTMSQEIMLGSFQGNPMLQ
ncbi:uncharacterized protein LOC132944915 [Metopolophium dirhodum]|uniref:uncharacterized protein LOC132944915 n=1 Tax=Metopolophium dirhodum TaxID=44670 RepID=UPI00298FD884|nr:uncharacterized protein LOC132944915 [Metopolophium dirhodum]